MASVQLLSKIDQLERELALLKVLSSVPPQLPHGFVVASVWETRAGNSNLADLCLPNEADSAKDIFIVVPAALGATVKLYAGSDGLSATSELDNRPFYGRWALTPEEAIVAFLEGDYLSDDRNVPWWVASIAKE